MSELWDAADTYASCEGSHTEPFTRRRGDGTTPPVRSLDALDPVGATCRSGHHRLRENPMAERSLRGSRLGALSMETDANVVPSERNITTYLCPNGHTIKLPVLRRGRRPAHLGVPLRCGGQAPGWGPGAGGQARQARPHPLGHAARASLDPRARGAARGAPRPSCASRAASAPASASPPDRPHRMPGTPPGCPASVMSGAGSATSPVRGGRGRRRCPRRPRPARRPAGRRPAGPDAGPPGPRPAPGTGPEMPATPPSGPSSRRATTVSSQTRVIGPGQRQDEEEPDDVGHEARGEQQGAADQHQGGVGELPARHPPAAQGVLQRGPGLRRPHA